VKLWVSGFELFSGFLLFDGVLTSMKRWFDSDPRLQLKPFIYWGLIGVRGKSSTILALVHYPARGRRGHAHCTDAGQIQPSYPYKMKAQDMTQRYEVASN
jgi:hypothetical protein